MVGHYFKLFIMFLEFHLCVCLCYIPLVSMFTLLFKKAFCFGLCQQFRINNLLLEMYNCESKQGVIINRAIEFFEKYSKTGGHN